MNIHDAIKMRIRQLLSEREWSVNELSRRSDVLQSTISELLIGRSRYPRINTIRKIAKGFGLCLSEFFDDEVFNNIEE